ncbi:hypothetical protein EP10_002364 [Geobacillus icigianus]|uniref:Uncharacterized protein n=1 Tax=Geobacillus icigianus TaxID=1430331 RepID=A0ABU6BHX1_9BACL|nr:hypothetical protein [Geobacillus icigianus]
MMLGLALDFSQPVIKPLVHLVDALYQGMFGDIDRCPVLEFSPKSSNHAQPFFHEKLLEREKTCLRSCKNGSFARSNVWPNGRINPFLFRWMIPFAKKRSLRHGLFAPFKGVIGTTRTMIIHPSEGIRSFGGWCTPSRKRFVSMIRRREEAKECQCIFRHRSGIRHVNGSWLTSAVHGHGRAPRDSTFCPAHCRCAHRRKTGCRLPLMNFS